MAGKCDADQLAKEVIDALAQRKVFLA